MKKLAIVCTHPVQYNGPWFALLHQRGKLAIKVFYTWSQAEVGAKYDPDFKRVVEWDIPLLEGYPYEFVENVAQEPGSHHFKGVNNPTLNKTISNWNADAVLVIGWSYKSHLACLRYFKGKIPVLFRGDSTLLDEAKGVKTILRRVFLTWVYRHVDKALYVGQNNKAYFKAHGLKTSQLTAAPHAVDNDRFSSFTPEHEKELAILRASLDIKEGDFVVLFAGKFEEKKNPFFLLQLAERMKDTDIVFLLVGNGPLEQKLKAAAASNSRIRFLPFQNQSRMPAVYRLGTVFLLPSNGPGETWGLAANEAMASGLPVILSSKCGGATDLVGDNGLVFGQGEIEKVAAYINELRVNNDILCIAKESSISRVKQFSFLRLAEAVEKACGL